MQDFDIERGSRQKSKIEDILLDDEDPESKQAFREEVLSYPHASPSSVPL